METIFTIFRQNDGWTALLDWNGDQYDIGNFSSAEIAREECVGYAAEEGIVDFIFTYGE